MILGIIVIFVIVVIDKTKNHNDSVETQYLVSLNFNLFIVTKKETNEKIL
jgi:hypothetical protein